jgi:hypothetical protein
MPRPPSGAVLTPLERERIHAAILNACSASLMSDAKWRKLLSVLKAIPSIDHYFLKSIRSDVEMPGHGFLSGYAPHAFMDTFSFGPIYLREIEWIEFPEIVSNRAYGSTPPGGHRQDLGALRRALHATGDFPLEETPRGLRVIGHVRKRDPKSAR